MKKHVISRAFAVLLSVGMFTISTAATGNDKAIVRHTKIQPSSTQRGRAATKALQSAFSCQQWAISFSPLDNPIVRTRRSELPHTAGEKPLIHQPA